MDLWLAFASTDGDDMTFNDLIDRRGTNSSKWDKMEQLYGVAPEDGLAL